jgi:FkbM family methyltransferase
MLSSLIKDTLRRIVPVQQKRLLIRYALANGMEVALDQLRVKGFRPGGAIDIGAYQGEWTKTFTRVFSDVPVLMIEAQSDKRRRLEGVARRIKADIAIETALLSHDAGLDKTFYVMETGSSMYPENTSVQRRQATLRTEALDAVMTRHPALAAPYLMKLDVQGAELDVLRGGVETVRRAEFVILEVSILNYNIGAPNWRNVTDFMESAGFLVYDIANLIRIPGGDLCQLDVIFVRNGSAFRSNEQLH